MRNCKFTLVELLMVIGIIAILAGILLPVINGAAKKADMTKAKAEITTLLNAIKQFESTYGVLPLPDGYTEGDPIDATLDSNKNSEYLELIKVLQAELPAGGGAYYSTNPNTRATRFLDVVGNIAGEFNDPWGNNYNIIFDENYDGKISTIPATLSNSVHIEADLFFSVVIWSEGANPNDTVSGIKDNIYSFPVAWDKNNNQYNITR